MFTTKDLFFMDWFTIISARPHDYYELISKSTGHHWQLIWAKDAFIMMHKHHAEDEYHYQTCLGSLYECVLYIVDHDEYQMRGRKNLSPAEEKKHDTYFWKLISFYGYTA